MFCDRDNAKATFPPLLHSVLGYSTWVHSSDTDSAKEGEAVFDFL